MALSKSDDDRIYDFSSPQHFSDLVLVVENVQFHVHKCILCLCSPVFEKMLTSDFREKDAKRIPLAGKRRDEFESFLKAIYLDVISGQEQQINDTNYESLLQLADEYQVSKVRHLCSEFLTSNITESNCFEILKVAEKYSLEDVMEKCAEKASEKPYTDLESCVEFRGLKPENKEKVLVKIIRRLERSAKTPQVSPSSVRGWAYIDPGF